MGLKNQLVNRYRKDPVGTIFSISVITLALLSFLKPETSLTFSGIATQIGISLGSLLIALLTLGAILYLTKFGGKIR